MSFLKCRRHLCSKLIQTDLSFRTDPDQFDTSNDIRDVENDSPPHLNFAPEEVQHLVSAVKGSDEEVRQKARVLNLNNSRIRKLIKELRISISEQMPNSNMENSLEYIFIRELAAAMDPASRHRGDLSLFHHQRNEKSPKCLTAMLQTGTDAPEHTEYTAALSAQSVLTLMNDTDQYEIDVPAEMLSKLYAETGFTVLTEDGSANFGVVTLHETIALDKSQILRLIFISLGVNSWEDLPYKVNCYDTSLIDCILSIPKLSSPDAAALVDLLHQKNLLSAYVRAKVAQELFSRTWAREQMERLRGGWPALLGRWVTLIDPSWAATAGELAEKLDVMRIFAKFERLATPAKIVLAIAMEIFTNSKRGDPVEYFWSVLFRGVIPNAGLDKKRENALGTICGSLPKKRKDSNTRKKTSEILASLRNVLASARFHAVDELKFLSKVVLTHSPALMTILSSIPFKGEESSPLFYPLALDMVDAKFEGEEIDETLESGSIALLSEASSASASSKRGKPQPREIELLEGDEEEEPTHPTMLPTSSTRTQDRSNESTSSRRSRSSQKSQISQKSHQSHQSHQSQISQKSHQSHQSQISQKSHQSQKSQISQKSQKSQKSQISQKSQKYVEQDEFDDSATYSSAKGSVSSKGIGLRMQSQKAKQPEPQPFNEEEIEIYEEQEEEEDIFDEEEQDDQIYKLDGGDIYEEEDFLEEEEN